MDTSKSEVLYDEYALVASTNSERFALGKADGYDLTCGERIEIFLGGRWIAGSVQHASNCYPQKQTSSQIMRREPLHVAAGYYFIGEDGGICGLCVDMAVRVRRRTSW